MARHGGPPLGGRVRALRRREGLTQAQLAERLGISTSYVNLIENNRRALSAPLLIRLAQLFSVDLQSFAGGEAGELGEHLNEVFGDLLFSGQEIDPQAIKEVAGTHEEIAKGVLTLYQAYRSLRESVDSMVATLADGPEIHAGDAARLPTEELTDFVQKHLNYFPDLEEGAERLHRDANLETAGLFGRLARHLSSRHRVEVRIEKVGAMGGAVRRFDEAKRVLYLSEILRRGSRNFALAYHVGLLEQADVIERLTAESGVTSEASRSLCRVVLAGYFAGAVLMPYGPFLEAARAERYDVEILGHRFRASFEQVCHRLTSLRRTGAEGVPFHLIRVDIAGNISKRFSASGVRFARFSAACPLWNVHSAFLTPGMIRVQTSRMPDGTAYFDVARTLRKEYGGYHASRPIQAINLGCHIDYAKELVYSDGVDLDSLETAVPVGTTCRVCERMDCPERALPPIQHPLKVDASVRGLSFYSPAK